MYAKVKKSLPEMYAFTVCMWLKSSAAPGVGTPFSYAVPGQANELVLIEWGNNPMEILINDKVEQPRPLQPPGLIGRPGEAPRLAWLLGQVPGAAGGGGGRGGHERHSHRCSCGPNRSAHQAGLREVEGEDRGKRRGAPWP